MSTRTIVSSYVSCDVCDVQANIVAEKQSTVRELARRELGWNGGHVELPGRRDICPDCWNGGWR